MGTVNNLRQQVRALLEAVPVEPVHAPAPVPVVAPQPLPVEPVPAQKPKAAPSVPAEYTQKSILAYITPKSKSSFLII